MPLPPAGWGTTLAGRDWKHELAMMHTGFPPKSFSTEPEPRVGAEVSAARELHARELHARLPQGGQEPVRTHCFRGDRRRDSLTIRWPDRVRMAPPAWEPGSAVGTQTICRGPWTGMP